MFSAIFQLAVKHFTIEKKGEAKDGRGMNTFVYDIVDMHMTGEWHNDAPSE